MITITILGSGNVAHHLILNLLKQNSVSLQQVYARDTSSLKEIVPPEKLTQNIATLKPASIFIIAVSDNAISEICNALPVSNQLVVHVSGTAPIDSIGVKQRSGVFYMLQTFSKEKIMDFSKIPFCIEASTEKDLKTLENLARLFSEKIYFIHSEQRKNIHLAAVFVSNFTNHMYTIGAEICKTQKISFDILKPLIIETANKIEFLNPKDAQTGPAIRGDSKTIQNHLEMLQQDKTKRELYSLITNSIQNKK